MESGQFEPTSDASSYPCKANIRELRETLALTSSPPPELGPRPCQSLGTIIWCIFIPPRLLKQPPPPTSTVLTLQYFPRFKSLSRLSDVSDNSRALGDPTWRRLPTPCLRVTELSVRTADVSSSRGRVACRKQVEPSMLRPQP